MRVSLAMVLVVVLVQPALGAKGGVRGAGVLR